MEKPFVPKTREERLTGKKLIIILENAVLEVIEGNKRSGTYELLNSLSHRSVLKKANREIDDVRPDITHQCLLVLQDSALNRSGHLAVFIRTADHQLIEISPHLTIPKTWIQFQAMMVTFLLRKSIKAQESNVVLMRFIKNNLETVLPVGTRKIGLSVTGETVDLNKFCSEELGNVEVPVTFFVGAVAKSDPTAKDTLPMLEKAIRISEHHLTAAMCCGKLCNEFEYFWKIV